MGGNRHKPNCQCRFCNKRKEKVENNNDSTYHIRNWPRDKCEDELSSIRDYILIKVRRMSNDWLSLVTLNQRKEKIETRLEELGFHQK